MIDFETSKAIEEILSKCGNKDKTIEVLSFVNKRLKEQNISITEYRWESLVNHISAMVKRSIDSEVLEGIDISMFEEISKESIDLAKEISNKIGNLGDNEAYLLSVHFETAKLQ